MTETATTGGPMPELPPAVDPEALREFDAAELDGLVEGIRAAERETVAAMAPYDRQIRELRARASLVATEQRRRERAARTAARIAVREQAKSGEMPTLTEVLEAGAPMLAEDRPLATARAFLATGGEVRFGYPTRPGTITFTDGRSLATAASWGDARRHYAEGMEPGTATLPGVRVHLVGTRIEKVIPPGELLIGPDEAG